MQVGDLIRIKQGEKLVPPWLGELGLLVGDITEVNSLEVRSGEWFSVLFSKDGRVRMVHNSYLEKVAEA